MEHSPFSGRKGKAQPYYVIYQIKTRNRVRADRIPAALSEKLILVPSKTKQPGLPNAPRGRRWTLIITGVLAKGFIYYSWCCLVCANNSEFRLSLPVTFIAKKTIRSLVNNGFFLNRVLFPVVSDPAGVTRIHRWPRHFQRFLGCSELVFFVKGGQQRTAQNPLQCAQKESAYLVSPAWPSLISSLFW